MYVVEPAVIVSGGIQCTRGFARPAISQSVKSVTSKLDPTSDLTSCPPTPPLRIVHVPCPCPYPRPMSVSISMFMSMFTRIVHADGYDRPRWCLRVPIDRCRVHPSTPCRAAPYRATPYERILVVDYVHESRVERMGSPADHLPPCYLTTVPIPTSTCTYLPTLINGPALRDSPIDLTGHRHAHVCVHLFPLPANARLIPLPRHAARSGRPLHKLKEKKTKKKNE